MPKFTVVAIEKFRVRTVYTEVEADSPDEAERLVREGRVAYDSHEIVEGDEEYVETESVVDRDEDLPHDEHGNYDPKGNF